MTKPLSSSIEDYLEVLLALADPNGAVRVTDVASRLGVAKSSVSEAMSLLKERGFVTQEKYGRIFLTEIGTEEARAVRRRHVILLTFLRDVLGVDPEKAEQDACQMEHAVGTESMQRMVAFLEKTLAHQIKD
ncbi:MAG: metal-dependent transcriptional regulator [Bacillota bacterium]